MVSDGFSAGFSVVSSSGGGGVGSSSPQPVPKSAIRREKDSNEVKAFKADYKINHPYPFASLSDVIDHFDHVVKLVGIDYVGIGSDYDGVGDSLPKNLKDVASYPNLIEGLLKRGYSEQDIAKILSGNVMRVWKAVESYAAQH